MLRFLIISALCLTIVFSGISLLISKVWGWSEYASPELYVVYQQWIGMPPFPYFLVDADGSGQKWKLTMENEQPKDLNCSPDGRTLAFLLKKHLYVVNSSGIIYDQELKTGYEVVGVNNSQDAYLSWLYAYRQHGDLSIVDATHSDAIPLPDQDNYTNLQVSSSGMVLWG